MSDPVIASPPKEKKEKKKRSKKEKDAEGATKKRKRLSISNTDAVAVDNNDTATIAQPTTKKPRRTSDAAEVREKTADPIDQEAPPKKKEKKGKKEKHQKVDKTTTTPTTVASANPADANCPYHIKTISLFLSLSPKYSFQPTKTYSSLLAAASKSHSSESTAHLLSLSPLHGIAKHHLDPLLMTFFEPVDGVVIAYRNIRFQSPTARIINESPFAHVWVEIEMLVWRPRKGMVVKGHVNLVSKSHIGLLVDNTWNVSIPLARIPDTWKWVDAVKAQEGHGYWSNDEGAKVEGDLKFEVQEVKAGGSLFLIEGSLLEREKIKTAVLPDMVKA